VCQPAFDCKEATDIPRNECENLVQIYNETNGDEWNNNHLWLKDTAACKWFGVTCGYGSDAEIHVKYLNLPNNNLN
jgi:hypothetical protein